VTALLVVTLLAALSRGERWFSHVQYLASDRLEGRATGTRGYRLAANYVAKQFAAAGLETQLQPVPYVVRRTDPRESRVVVGDRELVHGRDFVFRLRASGDESRNFDGVEADGKLNVVRSSAEDWPIELSDAALPNAVPASTKLRDPEQPLTIIVSPEVAPLFEKGARIRARHVIRTRRVEAPNVIGVLRGSVASEAVVVSAHLDHLGIGLPVNGDATYNGALDNSSGVASLIEIARELRARGAKPRRSIVFLAPGAEEDGSYGSWYFVHHPLPRSVRVVADLNIDGNSAFYPFRSVMAVGTESLQADVAAAAGDRVKVVPDPAPQRNTVAGSDQYSFIRAGIPALLVRRTAPDPEGRKLIVSIMASAYHQPSDDLRLPWKPETAAAFDDFMADLALRVANR
jgi:peptidase M28-like protein